MSTFIIAALTTDGFIAKNAQHRADWTCAEDKKFFHEMTKKAGVMVMGSTTYETIGMPLPGRTSIVYSRTKHYEGVETTQKSPQELVQDLQRRGFTDVAICGGSTVYTMFMEANLVDKLYLTVEPVLFGTGLTLFNKELDKKLILGKAEKLGEHALLLEYNVVKT